MQGVDRRQSRSEMRGVEEEDIYKICTWLGFFIVHRRRLASLSPYKGRGQGCEQRERKWTMMR
jgi:hypothetical protein